MEQNELINSVSSALIVLSSLVVFFGSLLQARRKGVTLGNALGAGYRSVQKMMNAQAKTTTQEQLAAQRDISQASSEDNAGGMIGQQQFREVTRELIAEFSQQIAEMAAERAVDIASLRTTLAETKAELGVLRGDLDAEKQSVDNLKTQLEATKTERDALNERVDALQTQHVADRAQWAQQRAEDRADYEAQIRMLTTQIAAKEERIADLERQLEELRKIKTGELPRKEEVNGDA